jgi:hypothetical protein
MRFAFHLGFRRVNIFGVTGNRLGADYPAGPQSWAGGKELDGVQFLIRDRDSKSWGPFDEITTARKTP